MELLLNAIDLMPRGAALLVIQLRGSGAGQPPLRSVHNRHHHLQIAQEFSAGSGGNLFLRLPLGFEKQRGIIQNALANRGRSSTPGRIELAGLAHIAVMFGEDSCHALAVLQALPCYRQQKPHRCLRHDLALAHLLLDGLGQKLY